MIHIKTEEEIEIMGRAGAILAEVMEEVLKAIKPGVSELELDALAEKLIVKRGGESGFKKVKGYHHTICIAVNEVVVHGIPTENIIREGDVVGIDCGVFLGGFHTDMAQTVLVKGTRGQVLKNKEKIERFLEIGEKALERGIEAAIPGNRVGNISKVIQSIVEKEGGYSIVRSLVGHGVGRELHEEPEIPGFLAGSLEKTPLLKPGMVIAVEIIYNMGKRDVVFANNDGWTIRTKDKSLSGVFERTVWVSPTGPIILTQ